MRPIHQPIKALGLITGQPGVQRLPRNPHLLGNLRHPQPIADHRQHWDMLRERRSVEQLEELLQERLEIIKLRRRAVR